CNERGRNRETGDGALPRGVLGVAAGGGQPALGRFAGCGRSAPVRPVLRTQRGERQRGKDEDDGRQLGHGRMVHDLPRVEGSQWTSGILVVNWTCCVSERRRSICITRAASFVPRTSWKRGSHCCRSATIFASRSRCELINPSAPASSSVSKVSM